MFFDKLYIKYLRILLHIYFSNIFQFVSSTSGVLKAAVGRRIRRQGLHRLNISVFSPGSNNRTKHGEGGMMGR